MSTAADAPVIDAERLRASFATVGRHGDEVALWFYSHLFISHPACRELFPVHMLRQRGRLLNALGHIVSRVDQLDDLVPFLQQLGRDHRKFGAMRDHYPAVGESLLATLAHFLGPNWTPELANDWRTAYTLAAGAMIDAAEAAADEPAWWSAEVISHEQRTFDIAVIRVRPQDDPPPYRAGQSLSVETSHQPRLWRYLSPANAPREDGTIEFHVQLVSGGVVSPSLVRHLRVGETLRLGSPVGHNLTLDSNSDRDLLLVAGGTGLAPLKAIVDQLSIAGRRRLVHLFHGARAFPALYDKADLDDLAEKYDWLTVSYALSDYSHDADIPQGSVGEIAARSGDWQDCDVMVCGSPRMVERTVPTLAQAGVPSDRIRFDDFAPR